MRISNGNAGVDRIDVEMQKIREILAIGKELRDRIGKASRRKGTDHEGVEREADERKLTKDDVYRYRQFADPQSGFADADLDELERLCRQHGYVPGITLLHELLRVPKQDGQRDKLLRSAAENRWKMDQLSNEIRKRQPRLRAPGGGWPPNVEKDVPGLLRQIEQHCTQWGRWVKAAKRDSTVPFDRLAPRVRERVDAAAEAMQELLTVAVAVAPIDDQPASDAASLPQPLREPDGTRPVADPHTAT